MRIAGGKCRGDRAIQSDRCLGRDNHVKDGRRLARVSAVTGFHGVCDPQGSELDATAQTVQVHVMDSDKACVTGKLDKQQHANGQEASMK